MAQEVWFNSKPPGRVGEAVQLAAAPPKLDGVILTGVPVVSKYVAEG